MLSKTKVGLIIIFAIMFSAVTITAAIPGDINRDKIINFKDFAIMSGNWLAEGTGHGYGCGVITVASFQAPDYVKDVADYVCDGVDDQEQIQMAIDSLRSTPSFENVGTICLSGGIFNITDTIVCGKSSYTHGVAVTIIGGGAIDDTILRFTADENKPIIRVGYDPRRDDASSTENCVISMVNIHRLKMDGNRENRTERKWSITGVDASNNMFTVAGDQTGEVHPQQIIRIVDSTGNDGLYAVKDVQYDASSTDIYVTKKVTDATVDGYLKADKPILDLVACKDSVFDHVYIDSGLGACVTIRRSWTLTFRECPIERGGDAGVIVYSNASPYNHYKAKYLKFRGNTMYCGNSGATYSKSGALWEIIKEGGGGASITDITLTENQCGYVSDAVHIEGAATGIFISNNFFGCQELNADDTYYCFKLNQAANGTGPCYVYIRDNICVMGSEVGAPPYSTLAAVIGCFRNSGSQAYPDYIYAEGNILYSNPDLSCDLFYNDAPASICQNSKIIPEPKHQQVSLASGSYGISGAQAWGGWIFMNTAASGSVEWDLPRAKAGMTITFARAVEQPIRLDPLYGIPEDTLDGSEETKVYESGTVIQIKCYADRKWTTITQK